MFADSTRRRRTLTRWTAGVLPLLVASACGDGEPLTAPDPVPPAEALTGGYFISDLCDELVSSCSQAIITDDGQVRIHLEDSRRGVGTLQFVGAIDPTAPEGWWFPGRLIGQECAGPDSGSPAWVCEGVPAQIRLAFSTKLSLAFRIRYVFDAEWDVEWAESMYRPASTYFTTPATFEAVSGTYLVGVADFAQHEAGGAGVLVTVDGSGNLSFRSAASGCAGEGVLSPYLDGARNVYSVEITIKDCNATYAYLNGSLEGLATRAINHLDEDFIDSLTVWLSSPPGAGSDVALTMWGDRQD